MRNDYRGIEVFFILSLLVFILAAIAIYRIFPNL